MRNMPNLNQIILSEDPVRFTKSGLIEISKNLPDTTILVKGVGEYLNGKYISFQWDKSILAFDSQKILVDLFGEFMNGENKWYPLIFLGRKCTIGF